MCSPGIDAEGTFSVQGGLSVNALSPGMDSAGTLSLPVWTRCEHSDSQRGVGRNSLSQHGLGGALTRLAPSASCSCCSCPSRARVH